MTNFGSLCCLFEKFLLRFDKILYVLLILILYLFSVHLLLSLKSLLFFFQQFLFLFVLLFQVFDLLQYLVSLFVSTRLHENKIIIISEFQINKEFIFHDIYIDHTRYSKDIHKFKINRNLIKIIRLYYYLNLICKNLFY